jgi:predicted nucleic acid-binding protein
MERADAAHRRQMGGLPTEAVDLLPRGRLPSRLLKKQPARARTARIRDHVLGLPIEVMPDQMGRIMTEVLALARQHGLTVYDASYLDLAMREGVPLASLDTGLVAAAERVGVPLFAP